MFLRVVVETALRIGYMLSVIQFFPFLIYLVRQAVAVEVYECKGSLALGPAVIEIAPDADGGQRHHRAHPDSHRAPDVPAFSSSAA